MNIKDKLVLYIKFVFQTEFVYRRRGFILESEISKTELISDYSW